MNKMLQLVAELGFALGLIFFRFAVFVQIWGYTAVPKGLPAIGFMEVLAMSMLVGLVAPEKLAKSDSKDRKNPDILISGYLNTALVWGLAYWVFG